MKNRILLVHPARSVRMLLARQILAELSNVEVEECRTAEEATALIAARAFGLVMAAPGPAALDALRLQQTCTGQADSPAILVVATEEELRGLAGILSEGDLTSRLRIPCSNEELTAAYEHASNPRKRRIHARLHIPGGTATFLLDGQPITGAVVNLSAGGLLAEVVTAPGDHRHWTRLLEAGPLGVALPGHAPLQVPAVLLRLQMAASPHGGATLRLAFRLAPADDSTTKALHEVLAEEARRLAQAWKPAPPEGRTNSNPLLWRPL
jgi:hypothetical protein